MNEMNSISESVVPLDVNSAVKERYSAAANLAEASLCCPVDYNPEYLKIIPEEILERDYGCGDPSRHVQEGDVVLDLGSGGGKICYIAAQIVGPAGAVIGVDCNDEMLNLARSYRDEIAGQLGYDVVEFRKGRIQDLALDLDQLEQKLKAKPIGNSTDWLRVQDEASMLRKNSPMIGDDSIDVIVSNCVLNLVEEQDRRDLLSGMFRVLKRGGRTVISDIVCDEPVPDELKADPNLWSGCISGAYREDEFLQAFEEAGFYGIEILERQEEPWAVIEGIEFRSLTVRAWKGKEGPCLERNQAVVYNGPWKAVIDDDGHKLFRGKRMAVCDKTFNIYSRAPYSDQITPIDPLVEIPLEEAEQFSPKDCSRPTIREASETKQDLKRENVIPGESSCCGSDGCC